MMAFVSGVTMRNPEPRISVGKTRPHIIQMKLKARPLKHPITDITHTGWKTVHSTKAHFVPTSLKQLLDTVGRRSA